MSKRILVVPFILFTACGGGGTDDPPPTADAPVVPATLTIKGQAFRVGDATVPKVSGATIEVFANGSDTTPLASATTDADGKYTLTITTNGRPLDGYLKASKADLIDTYIYPPRPVIEDFSGAIVNFINQSTYDTVSTLCSGGSNPQSESNGFVAVLVSSSPDLSAAASSAVEGATITSTPAPTKSCYNIISGNVTAPSGGATATARDGIGYLLNVTGSVKVSASKAGATFLQHVVTARPGAVTTTVVTP